MIRWYITSIDSKVPTNYFWKIYEFALNCLWWDCKNMKFEMFQYMFFVKMGENFMGFVSRNKSVDLPVIVYVGLRIRLRIIVYGSIRSWRGECKYNQIDSYFYDICNNLWIKYLSWSILTLTLLKWFWKYLRDKRSRSG